MPKGGFRPGAGRKTGAATVRTRQIANELALQGETPLQVLVSTMCELWQQAADAPTAAERLEKKLAACEIAEKAAPYIHPRLAAVAASVRQVTSDTELVAMIRSLGGDVIEGQAEPLPLPAGKHDLN